MKRDFPRLPLTSERALFATLAEKVREFCVGGYQALDKWLKDRKGRRLSSSYVRRYQRIVIALSETRRLMREIDGIIPGWPIE